MDQKFDTQVMLHEIHEDFQPYQSICSQRYESVYEILCQEEIPQDRVVNNTCMKIIDNEVTCDESCLPRQELFSIEDHNNVVPVKVHESSLLGKLEIHEEPNIQVLPIIFQDHQNDMDDMHKVICIGVVSVQTQDDIPQVKLPKVISNLFDKQKISFDAHNMDVMFEDVQGCMDGFVDLRGREDKYVVAFLFDDVLGIEDTGQQRPSIMNEFNPHGFTHQEKVIFYDCQNCLVSLFHSSMKVKSLSFTSSSDGFSFYSELLIDDPLLILFKHSQGAHVLDQLFDWLYLRFHIS